jgi:hypothetical protein
MIGILITCCIVGLVLCVVLFVLLLLIAGWRPFRKDRYGYHGGSATEFRTNTSIPNPFLKRLSSKLVGKDGRPL